MQVTSFTSFTHSISIAQIIIPVHGNPAGFMNVIVLRVLLHSLSFLLLTFVDEGTDEGNHGDDEEGHRNNDDRRKQFFTPPQRTPSKHGEGVRDLLSAKDSFQ